MDSNTFQIFLKNIEIDGEVFRYYDVSTLNIEKYGRNNLSDFTLSMKLELIF